MSKDNFYEFVGMVESMAGDIDECGHGVKWAAEYISELEEDLRIANRNLDIVEKWQDKVTEVYPVVAEHITRALYVAPPQESGDV